MCANKRSGEEGQNKRKVSSAGITQCPESFFIPGLPILRFPISPSFRQPFVEAEMSRYVAERSEDDSESEKTSKFSAEVGRTDRMKHLDVRSGPATDSYERYVRRIFAPGALQGKEANRLADFSMIANEINCGNPIPDIPASLLLKMEKMERADQVDSRHFSPLEMMEKLYGQYGMEESKYAQFPVYQPKASSEYYSIMNNKPRVGDTPARDYKVARTANSPNVYAPPKPVESVRYRIHENQRRFTSPSSPHHLLIDYHHFKSKPLSPFLCDSHRSPTSVSRRNDSRILGSDFVIYHSRHPDPFFNRIDAILSRAKKC